MLQKDACLANPDINSWIDYFDSTSKSNLLINKDISDCDLESLIENYDVIYHLDSIRILSTLNILEDKG